MIGPEAFMNHAKKILMQKNDPQEADFRSAVSRAYYSIYHEALKNMFTKHQTAMSNAICKQLDKRNKPYDRLKIESLDFKYIKNQRINLHQIIPTALASTLDKTARNKFRSFRTDRNRADYEINTQYTIKQALDKVRAMEKFAIKIRQS